MKRAAIACAAVLALGVVSFAESRRNDSLAISKLEAVAARDLEGEGDAAAVLDLATRKVIFRHHPRTLDRRMLAGSVMKLASAYAILEAGLAEETYRCMGEDVDRFGVRRACWLKGGHGDMRLHTAIASSCNLSFQHQAAHLDPDRFLFAMAVLGLDPPKMPLLSERELPDAAVGDLFGLEVTPRGLLDMAAIIALRAPPARGEWLEVIAEGMAEVTRSGTLADPFRGIDAAAKTGTAKRAKGSGATRGIVAGFTPVRKPRFAFVVVKDRGRGAIDAGPAAANLVRALAEERP